MGDKITQLPVATTVDGTEIVPIVQGGATKQVTGAILRRPVGAAGGDLAGTYPNPTLAAITTAQTVGSVSQTPVITVDAKGRVTSLTTAANPQGTVTSVVGGTGLTGGTITSTGTLAVSYGTTAGTAAQGNDSRLSDSRTPTGAAGGDLAGTFPNPTLAAVTTAQSNIGSGTQVPVISVDAKGRVTSLSSVPVSASADAITALTGDVTATGPGSVAGTLASITTAQTNIGSSTTVPVISVDAKGRVTALSSTPISGSAGGTVTSITAGTGLSGGTITSSGTIALADVTTAQTAVGNSTTIPVITVNAQGQITALTTATAAGGVALATTAPSDLASTAQVGTGTTAARADHQHAFPTAANVGALGATAAAGGDLTGNYPNPTLAAITTAQSNIGSSSQIPVISIDAKGRVTALSSVSVIGSVSLDYLVVSGGGGGTGGGGGAGGLRQGTILSAAGSVISATVGAGGAGVSYTGTTGNNGSASQITHSSTIASIGGGAGGRGGGSGTNLAGADGGSGGGAGLNTTLAASKPGGLGTAGQGNNGGATPGIANSPSGGGGGAGAVGADGAAGFGGNGGVGLQSSITGTAVYYAGGGGGSCSPGAVAGTGGLGGGGNATTGGVGVNATANTGGGGGGSNISTGGNGGSGVVILSIPTANYSGTTTGSPVVTTSGSRTILTFNSSGTYTV